MFIFQKTVDRSLLRQGFQIPVEFHHCLRAMPGGYPLPGETRNITLIIDGNSYEAQLKNQGFDRQKYADHADVIQIRYGENSDLANHLRSVFSSTWQYVNMIKSLPENIGRKFTIKIPENIQEHLSLIATDIENVFYVDCFTCEQKTLIEADLQGMDELDFETFTPIYDYSASIQKMSRIQRIRHLDRSVGDSLKQLYDYKCQMTGERIGNDYGALVVEAHHIKPFTESLNNDSSNIIILSPTYHRIIHAAKPEWDANNLAFRYPNGLIEKVRINHHL